MTPPSPDTEAPRAPAAPLLRVEVLRGKTAQRQWSFSSPFVIGRLVTSDLCVEDPSVSRRHAEVSFDGEDWWVRDLESRNGTFLDGVRVERAPVRAETELQLGQGGAVLRLVPERPAAPEPGPPPSPGSVTEIIQHYFGKDPSGTSGAHTLLFRRAFERAHRKKSRKYAVAVGAALVALAVAGGVILHQRAKIATLRRTAEGIFYSMKTLELQVARLEDLARRAAEGEGRGELPTRRLRLQEMVQDYDQFLQELDVYGKLSAEDRVIVRMARRFGECELTVPKGFAATVRRYVDRWRSTNRLRDALARADEAGYVPVVQRALAEQELPPHFFFLALQESDFRPRAVGPETRYGFAKGIWQFIPPTAERYGLKVGPRYQQGVYDPRDERFDFPRATRAAAAYLRDINNTEAQASGLLVMASYNWGENRVRQIIRAMPENPRERNFWKLLEHRDIPQETYDYVFYIFSAAVVCDNPGLFGFDLACPDFGSP